MHKALGMCLFALALASASQGVGETLPSFFWSGRPYFRDNAHALESVPSAALSGVVSQILGAKSGASTELGQYVRAPELQRELPRVFVALLHGGLPALQSVEPDSVLASSIRSSTSSLAVPHAYSAGAGKPSLREHIEGLGGASVSLAQLQDTRWLRSTVSGTAAQPRLLVVEAHGAEGDEAPLRRAFESIHNETAGNYVVMVAPLESVAAASRPAARRLLGFPLPDEPFPMPKTTGTWACPYWETYDPNYRACFRYIYITPSVLAGVAVGVLLLFVTGVALNCLADVRTPPYLDMQVDEKVAKERARLIRGREF